MIKTLYIVRHSQAEDLGYGFEQRDFDRDLTAKGLIQSARIGDFLAKENRHIDCFISSPANRAYQTAKVFMEQMGINESKIELNEDLYGGGPKAYLSSLNSVSEAFSSMAIFGHNPDMTYFAEYLTRDDILGSMKKATFIEMSFENMSWAEISGNMGSVIRRVDVKDIKVG